MKAELHTTECSATKWMRFRSLFCGLSEAKESCKLYYGSAALITPYLLGCDAVWSGRISLTFMRNRRPQSSRSESKPNKLFSPCWLRAWLTEVLPTEGELNIVTDLLKEFLSNASKHGDYATIKKALFSVPCRVAPRSLLRNAEVDTFPIARQRAINKFRQQWRLCFLFSQCGGYITSLVVIQWQ
jgi:hypothetical protein